MQQLKISEEDSKQECAKLEKTWSTLNDLIMDLVSKGFIVPAELRTSLQSTRALIAICRANPRLSELTEREVNEHAGFCVGCCGRDVATRIKCELRNVEDRLITQATNQFGNDFAVKLQQKTAEAWEQVQDRIITRISTLTHAAIVERDVVAGYQKIVEENLFYWQGAAEDLVNSYTKIIEGTSDPEIASALKEIIRNTKDHIEALESFRESLRKLMADAERHANMLKAIERE